MQLFLLIPLSVRLFTVGRSPCDHTLDLTVQGRQTHVFLLLHLFVFITSSIFVLLVVAIWQYLIQAKCMGN